MNANITIKLLIFFVMTVSLSCEHEEFFEEISPEQTPWFSVGEFDLCAAAAYNSALWGGYAPYTILDLISNTAYSSESAWVVGHTEDWPQEELHQRDFSYEIDEFRGAFTNSYKTIGICNSGIDFYLNFGEIDGQPFEEMTSGEIENADRIAGELHFMRAHAYFGLVTRNRPVFDKNNPVYVERPDEQLILHTIPPKTSEEILYAKPAKTEEVYYQIIRDLKMAKELLPESYNASVHPEQYAYGRANQFAAAALLSRVYFYMGYYDSAAIECTYVIENNGGQYNLSEDPFKAFSYSAEDPSNFGSRGKETIWQVTHDDKYRAVDAAQRLAMITKCNRYAINGGRGRGNNWSYGEWHNFIMSDYTAKKIGWLSDTRTETDVAKRDKRYQQLWYRFEGYNILPFADTLKWIKYNKHASLNYPTIHCDKYFRGTDGNVTHIPLIRLPEMYLTRAIARFRSGDLQGAADDMNVVRKRAWDEDIAGITYESSVAFLTSSNITEEEIHIERIREMGFEGDYWLYRKALRLPLLPGDRKEDVPNRYVEWPYTGLYHPIPRSELDSRRD